MANVGPSLVATAWTDDETGILIGMRHHEKLHVCGWLSLEFVLAGSPDEREGGTAAMRSVGKRLVTDFVHA